MMSIFNESDASYTEGEKYSQFNRSFNKLAKVSTEVGELEKGITDAETDFGIFGVLNSLINSAWNALKLIFTSFGFMNPVFLALNYIFGVPLWIGGLVNLAIIVLFVFVIYSAIFQREI